MQMINAAAVKDLPSLYDGLFKVARDGRVYRRKNDRYVLATQTKYSLNGRYLAVSAYVDGKQNHYYVHRLVAEAYIPNPENKPTVNHRDCNGRNNAVSNLEWATYQENTNHAVFNGLNRSVATCGVPCVCCGNPTLTKNRVCRACKIESKIIEKRLSVVERKAEIVEVILNKVEIDEISERNLDMLRMYSRGATLQEIGDRFGITRERVRQIIDRYLNYSPRNKITEPQKQISTYIDRMGFKKTKLAKNIGMDCSNLCKMLNLRARMPHDIFEKLCELTRFNYAE